MLVLAGRLADIHSQLYGCENRMTDEDLAAFIRIEYGRIGADVNITPREVIRDLIELLNILSQNPDRSVSELLGSGDFEYAKADPLAQDNAGAADEAGLYSEFNI